MVILYNVLKLPDNLTNNYHKDNSKIHNSFKEITTTGSNLTYNKLDSI